WDRRSCADGDQGPADRSPLLAGQFFGNQQRDARTEHCTCAGHETDLRNCDFVLFICRLTPLMMMLIHHKTRQFTGKDVKTDATRSATNTPGEWINSDGRCGSVLSRP